MFIVHLKPHMIFLLLLYFYTNNIIRSLIQDNVYTSRSLMKASVVAFWTVRRTISDSEFEWAYLCRMSFISLCDDSPPCSDKTPNPCWMILNWGMMWSSSMWSLGGKVENIFLYFIRNPAIHISSSDIASAVSLENFNYHIPS